ncbi:MAG: DNA polymerase III subunit gamma/tau [Clostridiales bacterium]|nr:DNA polymerase III subunit gamma/tau [Clostridiales bacterium]
MNILAYTALYRQWRPEIFDDVIGQDAIVRILKNQIENNRIGHAYLFCGSRGTGKTSTAKVFAKAVNCLTPVNGNPCLACDVCQKLSLDNNMDIIEIDAASNNGVDEIRDLRDKVKYPPVIGRYRVYIIDEVHMLSTGAFNALLKTLEEPPQHIIFILATTEPHRLPATILSRCQRYNFKRIPNKPIVERLETVARQSGVQIESDALNTIARWAEGSMRDALSLMDQCIGFCDNYVTNDDVLAILGTADQEFVFNVVQKIIEGNSSELFGMVETLIDDGRDVAVFVRDLIQHLRNLLVVKMCREPEALLDVGQDTLMAYVRQAQEAGHERLIRAIEILCSLEADMKWSTQPRVLLEMALVKICRPEQEETLNALLDRVERLERQIREGRMVQQAVSSGVDFAEDNAFVPSVDQYKRQANEQIEKTTPDDDVKARDEAKEHKEEIAAGQLWAKILNAIKKEREGIYWLLENCDFRIQGKSAILAFSASQQFSIDAINREENRSFIEGIIEKILGKKMKIRCCLLDEMMTDEKKYGEKITRTDNEEIVEKAIDIFGSDFVEVVDD